MTDITFNPDGTTVTREDTDEEKALYAIDAANLVPNQWAALRYKRNLLLSSTDWMANSDVTMSDDWKTYRQQLRDLPSNTSDPANPTWPTKPS
ncbi:hypothetical protein PRRG_00023 [Prochlorococcus phage P-RSP2]|nr:hypothetical protein PRRG_00023 [Prochlorococcus phage P-RSP2]